MRLAPGGVGGQGKPPSATNRSVTARKVLPSRKRYCRKLNSPCLAASPVPPAACTTHFVHQFLHLVVVWATTWSTPLERLQLFSEFMVLILNNCGRLAAHYRASYYISQPLVRAANKHSIIVAVVDRVQPRQVRREYAVRMRHGYEEGTSVLRSPDIERNRKSCEEVCRLAQRHLSSIQDKLAELQRLASELNRISLTCNGRMPIAECRIMEALCRE